MTCALVAVLVGAALAALHTTWGRERLRLAVLPALRASFPGGAELRAVEGSPLGDLVLRDLVLKDRARRPAVVIQRLRVNLGLFALVRHRLRIEELALDGVAILAHHDGAALNLATMTQPSDEPSSWPVELAALRVTRAAVTLERAAEGGAAVDHLDDLEVAGSLATSLEGGVRASLQVTGAWRERGLAGTVRVKARARPGLVEVEDAAVELPGASLRARRVRYAGLRDARGALEVRAEAGALRVAHPALAELPALSLDLTVARLRPLLAGALSIDARGALGGAAIALQAVATPDAASPRVAGALTLTDVEGSLLPRGELAETSLRRARITFGLAADARALGLATTSGRVQVAAALRVAGAELEPVELDLSLARGEARAALRFAAGRSRLAANAAIALEAGGPVFHEASVEGRLAAADLPGRHELGGVVDLALHARGPLPLEVLTDPTSWREPPGAAPARLSLAGTAHARALRVATWAAGRVDLDLGEVELLRRPRGRASVVAEGVTSGGEPWPALSVQVQGDTRGGFEVRVAAAAAAGGAWDGTAQLAVRPDPREAAVAIELRELRGRVRGLPLSASAGRLDVRPGRAALAGLELRAAGGLASLSGARVGDALSATFAVRDVALAQLALAAPALVGASGRVSVAGELALRGERVELDVRGDARALRLREAAPALNAELAARADPRAVRLSLKARGAQVGAAELELDVAPPRRMLDGEAWLHLARTAVTRARLRAQELRVDGLAQLLDVPPPARGALDLELELTPAASHLELTAPKLEVTGAPAPAELSLRATLDDTGRGVTAARVALRGHGAAELTAALHLPERPLEAASWRRLAERVPRASLSVPAFALPPVLLERAGLAGWSGRAAATFAVDVAAESLRGTVSLVDLRGGALRAPAALDLELTVLDGRAHIATAASLGALPVLALEAAAPLHLRQLAEELRRWRALPLEGELRLGPLALAPLLAALGAEDLPALTGARPGGGLRGSLRGGASLSGTLAAPTAQLELELVDLASSAARVRELRARATYAAAALRAEVSGVDEAGGTLRATVDVQPARLREARVSLEAKRFDLAPLARLIPEALLGVSGKLDAALQVDGLDVDATRVAGELTIRDVRVPIANQLGTLTKGELALRFEPGRATAELRGQLEAGAVSLSAKADLAGVIPRAAELDLSVRDLTLISALAPKIDGALHATAQREGRLWRVAASLRGGSVKIPAKPGRELHPTGPPADIVFVQDARTVTRPPRSLTESAKGWAGSRTRDPWVQLALEVKAFKVTSPQLTGVVEGDLALAIGDDGISVDGAIGVSRGDVRLFERRYQLQRAAISFDGPLDPAIDIKLQHDFPQLSLSLGVRGRVSDPKLDLSSQPADYTEAQLLGFVLGGTPGGPGRDSLDAASGVAAAVTSQVVSGFLAGKLPVRLDVVTYQPSTLTGGGSVVVGRWLTDKVLLLLRRRTNASAVENTTEGELQYWLRRNLLLNGVAGDVGAFGLDLLWNRRW